MIAAVIISSIVSLIVWICVIVSFSRRRKLAELALMGAKIVFIDNESQDFIDKAYQTTDKKVFDNLSRAHLHQWEISKDKAIKGNEK